MKMVKNILLLFALMLSISLVKVSASANLTIDDKNFDNSTNVFTVLGTSTYEEVMVSLFDGDDLLTLKTVDANNNEYEATFYISFSEDKEVTIKVGDIDSTDYALTTLNVEKSLVPVKSNKLTDEGGNSLTILDSLKKFELEDELDLDIEADFDELSEQEQALINFIKSQLGIKKNLVAIMSVRIINDRHDVELEETDKGYKLFLNIDKETISSVTKPHAARVLDEETLELEEAQKMEYSDEEAGVVLKLNNIGVYLLYEDLSIYYEFLDGTGNPTYNLKKDTTLTLKVDAEYDKFLDVYMDGKKVDKKNYDSKAGSTVVTLKKEYMQSLKEGKHDIKIDFTDGEADTTLTVTNYANPKTLDDIVKYILLGIISLVGIFAIAMKARKKQ